MASTNDVCCIGREGGQRKNVNDVGLRWGDIYMTGTGHSVKQEAKVAKRVVNWRWRVLLGNDFDGNKNMF